MLRIQPTAVAARGCSRQHECATTILPCGRPPSTAAAIATGVEENVFHRRYLHSPYLRLMSLRSGSARRLSAVRRMNATAGSERGLRGLKDTPNTELRGSEGATFSDSPAVYAVLDDSGVLQYVGMTQRLSSAMRDHAHCVPPSNSKYVKFQLMEGASRAELHALWKSWIKEHGAVPRGNMKGQVVWTQRAPVERAFVPSLRDAGQHRSPAADALISAEAVSELCERGFVVMEDVLPAGTLAQVQRDCAALHERGVMSLVEGGSQVRLGRSDMICVLDEADDNLLVGTGASNGGTGERMAPVSSIAPGEEGAGLREAARLMKGLPHALMSSLSDTPMHAGAETVHCHLAVPHSLMLAVYPGEGTHYVPHLDNDEHDLRTQEGPVGA
mmetsp:Transcript_35639/g.89512  ORF Transcript_35639/g.89512 Transcript_35639/m.89512 type:complete len:386 (+) Transcript_35639:104-1261(+)